MTRLPPKRQRERSGILREPRREWPRHRRFIRSFSCCVPGCAETPIQVAHIRSAANSGTGIKPHDSSAVPMCVAHHYRQHQIGQPAFEKTYGVNLAALATELMRKSPDKAMREAMQAEVSQPEEHV